MILRQLLSCNNNNNNKNSVIEYLLLLTSKNRIKLRITREPEIEIVDEDNYFVVEMLIASKKDLILYLF